MSGNWDKVAGWTLLLAFVFDGTQVLLAQHSQDNRAASVHEAQSLTTPMHDDSVESGKERKHWSAEPACFEQSGDIPDRSVSRSWTLASPDGLYAAYAENEAVAERSLNGKINRMQKHVEIVCELPQFGRSKGCVGDRTYEKRLWKQHRTHRLVLV